MVTVVIFEKILVLKPKKLFVLFVKLKLLIFVGTIINPLSDPLVKNSNPFF
jgi:hypothetical protein